MCLIWTVALCFMFFNIIRYILKETVMKRQAKKKTHEEIFLEKYKLRCKFLII